MSRQLLPGLCLLLLVACGGEEEGASGSGSIAGPTIGTLPTPWNRYYVTAFDMAKVAAVRASAAFQSSTIAYSLQLPGHPVYDSVRRVNSNALREIGLDYAFSTGLTGKGQTVAVIDDRVNGGHIQFRGKTTFGTVATGGDFHGTAVASIAVGTGAGGAMTGVAPGAALYAARIDYDRAVDWAALGRAVLGARDAGAVALNNSWGLEGATVASYDYAASFGSGAGASYVAALKSYVAQGVVVFAAQNDYAATSINAMAGLPSAYPALEPGWIAVINLLPGTDAAGAIIGATRLSAPCAEAARYCLGANGQTLVADYQTAEGTLIGSGASFAAPQVAGALALLAEAFPDLSPAQLRQRLLATANNSFYAHTGRVTFAPGVGHGYNREFGMGVLDLRAALLPIGATYVPTATGAAIAEGAPALAGSPASGDAIVTALGKARVLSVDAMGGVFSSSAARVAATAAPVSGALRLGRAMSGRMGARRLALNAGLRGAQAGRAGGARPLKAVLRLDGVMEAPDAAGLSGLAKVTALEREGLRVALLRGGDGVAGLSLAASLPLAGGALALGVGGFRDGGSVLGIAAPAGGGQLQSWTGTLSLGFGARLGRGLGLRLQGAFGVTKGRGAGVVSGFTPVAHDRIGLTLDRADALVRGDLLSLFLRRPLGITSGSAILTLPTSYAAGRFGYSELAVGLSPARRELALGVEYSAPLGGRGALVTGLAYRRNAGNIAGREGVDATAALRLSF